MAAIQRFRAALQECQVDPDVTAEIMGGYESITDKAKKEDRAAFFVQAMQRMDARLDAETCHAIRDACACSKGGWRLKAVQKLAREYADRGLEEKLQALGQVRYMGKPVLNEDGTITAGIGDEGGFECPCPVFNGSKVQGPVSITYCYCCAGHFRHHYQIALGKTLKTRAVLSSALESGRTRPCRFVYEIVD
ncbi:MAG: DUF6144 family protein [Chloroflexi bacterium]|nr:DUF6144 family protein [Chloroflexota bacterium]